MRVQQRTGAENTSSSLSLHLLSHATSRRFPQCFLTAFSNTEGATRQRPYGQADRRHPRKPTTCGGKQWRPQPSSCFGDFHSQGKLTAKFHLGAYFSTRRKHLNRHGCKCPREADTLLPEQRAGAVPAGGDAWDGDKQETTVQ